MTIEQVNDAIYTLFWFRADVGLEAAIMFRRRELMPPYYDPTLWSMCSTKTQKLAEIYTDYMRRNCCDDRPMNFYPLLDRIEEWINDEYGQV